MAKELRLTVRDKQILQALCVSVRLFTLEQVAHHWWLKSSNRLATARRRMGLLGRVGYLSKQQVLAAPLPSMQTPILSWKPGEAEPDHGAIAWRLQSRWTQSARMTSAYMATPRASQIFGGKAKGYLKQEYQASHDLGVAQMYLYVLSRAPKLASAWIGEDVLAPYRKGQKLPDAVISASPSERPLLVLEFGGAYDRERVQAFHADCRDRGLPYQLW